MSPSPQSCAGGGSQSPLHPRAMPHHQAPHLPTAPHGDAQARQVCPSTGKHQRGSIDALLDQAVLAWDYKSISRLFNIFPPVPTAPFS